MQFDGGKAGGGVSQWLINLMPAHDLYVEPFLGAGAVLKAKRPAASSIAIERDARTLELWRGDEVPGLKIVHGDALSWLGFFAQGAAPNLAGAASPETARGSTLLYCDPPYLMSTRSYTKRPLYRCELTDADHVELLRLLRALPCHVMLSGYMSDLYATALADWRTESFWTVNRRGKRVQEWVWLNFPAGLDLHDTRYVGGNYRERERIRRQQHRWRARLGRMSPLERQALMSALEAEEAAAT